ncbi:Tau-tubulin kinase 2 [Phlyctochytrium planicorne]|nr:Tau-tubulin kinase 2 [Phlyctochytrium planicorne]
MNMVNGGGAPQGPPQPPPLRNVVIKGRWRIMDTIGKGAFGEVYTAVDLQTSETVAIKIETPACKKPVLKLEISVLRKLQDSPYVCRHIAAGRFTWPQNMLYSDGMVSPSGSPTTSEPPVYSYMVMELLGSNLSELRRKAPQGRFSLATTTVLAKQMLRSIEALHNIGILHRDIKPGNFCMELMDSVKRAELGRPKCYLIDFGLSRRFLTPTGAVREPRSKVGFRGTARYASINAHLGLELGRVDDLWSLFYLVVEFLNGQLPWKGKEKERIGELKQSYTGEDLCLGLPQLLSMHQHLSNLTYLDRPNYDLIYNLLQSLFLQSGKPENTPYDWELVSDGDTLGDSTIADSIDGAMHQAVAVEGYDLLKEEYKAKEKFFGSHPMEFEETRGHGAEGSASARPSDGGLTLEGEGSRSKSNGRWDRPTSLSSATVTIANAIGSAFGPMSPISPTTFRIPLSPGPEPSRRSFADENIGRRNSLGGYPHPSPEVRLGRTFSEPEDAGEEYDERVVPELKSQIFIIIVLMSDVLKDVPKVEVDAPPAPEEEVTFNIEDLAQPPKAKLGEVLGQDDSFTKCLSADPLTPFTPTAIVASKMSLTATPAAPAPPATPSPSIESPASEKPDSAKTSRTASGKELRISRQVHAMYTFIEPEPLPDPIWLGISMAASELIEIDFEDDPDLIQILSGAKIPEQCRPWAHNYAGHQFGFYAGQLGDGRAVSLGEIPLKTVSGQVKERWELQLKGSGRTPYSRFGDGYAVVRSSVREFLASEYMAAIGVPTTRALCVLGGSRAVYRENGIEPGAITARISPSWVRFGSFELFWYRGEKDKVRELADYVIQTHFDWIDKESGGTAERWMKVKAGIGGGAQKQAFNEAVQGKPGKGRGRTKGAAAAAAESPTDEPEAVKQPVPETDPRKESRKMSVATRPNLRVAEERSATGEVQAYVVAPYAIGKQVDVALNRYARFFLEVTRRTAVLMAHWQAAGFCHGVMNTDNMSILGLTIDYGPYMFLDNYNPLLSSNKSDDLGRYRFEHQPKIALWNLSKLGRTLLTIIIDEPEQDEEDLESRVDALDIIRQILDTFEPTFIEKYMELMRKKLGFRMLKDNDLESIVTPLLQLMSDVEVDYTIFFRKLCDFKTNDNEFYLETGPPIEAPMSMGGGSEGGGDTRASMSGGRRTSLAPQSLGRPSTFGVTAAPNLGRRSSNAAAMFGPPPGKEGFQGTSSGCMEMLVEALSTLSIEVAAEQSEYKIPDLEKPKKKKMPAKISEDSETKDENKDGENKGDEEQEDDEDDDDEDDEEDEDDPFAVRLPTSIEIKYRWQKWARAYRSRLLLERAASKSSDSMDEEDKSRAVRMKKANPKFSLRNWIMQDLVEAVEGMPALAPKDPEIERMEKELEEMMKLSNERQHRLKRDKTADTEDEPPPVQPPDIRKGLNELPMSLEVIDRAMRIIIGDVWGEKTDADGWDGKDKAFAQEWGGPVPKWGKNISLSCSSKVSGNRRASSFKEDSALENDIEAEGNSEMAPPTPESNFGKRLLDMSLHAFQRTPTIANLPYNRASSMVPNLEVKMLDISLFDDVGDDERETVQRFFTEDSNADGSFRRVQTLLEQTNVDYLCFNDTALFKKVPINKLAKELSDDRERNYFEHLNVEIDHGIKKFESSFCEMILQYSTSTSNEESKSAEWSPLNREVNPHRYWNDIPWRDFLNYTPVEEVITEDQSPRGRKRRRERPDEQSPEADMQIDELINNEATTTNLVVSDSQDSLLLDCVDGVKSLRAELFSSPPNHRNTINCIFNLKRLIHQSTEKFGAQKLAKAIEDGISVKMAVILDVFAIILTKPDTFKDFWEALGDGDHNSIWRTARSKLENTNIQASLAFIISTFLPGLVDNSDCKLHLMMLVIMFIRAKIDSEILNTLQVLEAPEADMYKVLQELVGVLSEIFPYLLDTIKKMDLPVDSVVEIYKCALSPFFVEASVTSKSLNLQMLQPQCVRVLMFIFSKYQQVRKRILEELVERFVNSSETVKKCGKYCLTDGRSIQMFTALVLQLIQSSSLTPQYFDAMERIEAILKNEEVIQDMATAESLVEALSLLRLNECEDLASWLVTRLFQHALSVPSSNSNYLSLLEHFAMDAIQLVGDPEWAAADVVVLNVFTTMKSNMEELPCYDDLKKFAANWLRACYAKYVSLGQETQNMLESFDIVGPIAGDDLRKELGRAGTALTGLVYDAIVMTLEYLGNMGMHEYPMQAAFAFIISAWSQGTHLLRTEEGTVIQLYAQHRNVLRICCKHSLHRNQTDTSMQLEDVDAGGPRLRLKEGREVGSALARSLFSCIALHQPQPYFDIKEIRGLIAHKLQQHGKIARRDAITALGEVLCVDLDFMMSAEVIDLVKDLLENDKETSIRLSVLQMVENMLGSEMSLDLLDKYLPIISVASGDASMNVRIKVQKFFERVYKSLYSDMLVPFETELSSTIVWLCSKVLSGFNDPEHAVTICTLRCLTEMWAMDLKSGRSLQSEAVVDAVAETIAVGEKCFETLSSEDKADIQMRANVLLSLVAKNAGDFITRVFKSIARGFAGDFAMARMALMMGVLAEFVGEQACELFEKEERSKAEHQVELLHILSVLCPRSSSLALRKLHPYMRVLFAEYIGAYPSAPASPASSPDISEASNARIMSQVDCDENLIKHFVGTVGICCGVWECEQRGWVCALEQDVIGLLSGKSVSIAGKAVESLCGLVKSTNNYEKPIRILRKCYGALTGFLGRMSDLKYIPQQTIKRVVICVEIVSRLVSGLDFDALMAVFTGIAASEMQEFANGCAVSEIVYEVLMEVVVDCQAVKEILEAGRAGLDRLFAAYPLLLVREDGVKYWEGNEGVKMPEFLEVVKHVIEGERKRLKERHIEAEDDMDIREKGYVVRRSRKSDSVDGNNAVKRVLEIHWRRVTGCLHLRNAKIASKAWGVVEAIVDLPWFDSLKLVPDVVAVQAQVNHSMRDRACAMFEQLRERHGMIAVTGLGVECFRKCADAFAMNNVQEFWENCDPDQDDGMSVTERMLLVLKGFYVLMPKGFASALVDAVGERCFAGNCKPLDVLFARLVVEFLGCFEYRDFEEIKGVRKACEAFIRSDATNGFLQEVDTAIGESIDAKHLMDLNLASSCAAMLAILKLHLERLFDGIESNDDFARIVRSKTQESFVVWNAFGFGFDPTILADSVAELTGRLDKFQSFFRHCIVEGVKLIDVGMEGM